MFNNNLLEMDFYASKTIERVQVRMYADLVVNFQLASIDNK